MQKEVVEVYFKINSGIRKVMETLFRLADLPNERFRERCRWKWKHATELGCEDMNFMKLSSRSQNSVVKIWTSLNWVTGHRNQLWRYELH